MVTVYQRCAPYGYSRLYFDDCGGSAIVGERLSVFGFSGRRVLGVLCRVWRRVLACHLMRLYNFWRNRWISRNILAFSGYSFRIPRGCESCDLSNFYIAAQVIHVMRAKPLQNVRGHCEYMCLRDDALENFLFKFGNPFSYKVVTLQCLGDARPHSPFSFPHTPSGNKVALVV